MKKFLNIRNSSIHGNGIFADRQIQANEIFYYIPLDRISNEPKPKQAKISEDKWVSDPEVLNWVNHSCNPSARLVVNVPKPYLIALRDIRKGDEITVNYDETESGGSKVRCECKGKDCKKYFLRVE